MTARSARLEAEADEARNELAVLDRHTAEAKDTVRAAIDAALAHLMDMTGISDDDGRCYTALLEALDDVVFDEREGIRSRIDAADEEIGNIEWRDLQLSTVR